MTRPAAPRTGADRDPDGLDRYYTPVATARRLLPLVLPDGTPGLRVLEPHVGGGAFVAAAREVWPGCRVHGLDVDRYAAGLVLCDVSAASDWRTYPPWLANVLVGNPPYRDAHDHISLVIDAVTRGTVQHAALLLRSTVLTSGWWSQITACPGREPAELHMIVGRLSFGGPAMQKRAALRLGTSDAAGSVWVIWRHGHAGPCVTRWLRLPVEDRR